MTTKTFIAAAFMAFIGLTGFAQTNENSSVKADIQMTQNHQIRIWFMDVQNDKIAFMVVDTNGNTLDKKAYRVRGNAKLVIETGNLSDGLYTVITQSNGKTVDAEQIMISNGEVLAFNQQFTKQNSYLVSK